MKALIACEESQRITIEMRNLGIECYSCDIEEPSGGYPEWHIHQDCIPLLNGNCAFVTMDNIIHKINQEWDLIIAHPPCTYLTVSGNRWFNVEKYGDKALERLHFREEAYNFFMQFVNAECQHIAIENPIGYMNSHYRKPDQIIQPWQFGHGETKATCWWLKNLPLLQPTNIVEEREQRIWKMSPSASRAKERSKTYIGIAKAIAEQWGNFVLKENK